MAAANGAVMNRRGKLPGSSGAEVLVFIGSGRGWSRALPKTIYEIAPSLMSHKYIA